MLVTTELVSTGSVAAQAAAPADQWSLVRDDRRDTYDAVTVTPGGAAWVAGTRRTGSGKTESLLLKGRTTFKRVTGPGFRVKRLTSASDTRVWAFGTSRYARWDGKRWLVKPWRHGRIDQAYSIGANLWVIEDSTTFPSAGKTGWKARSTVRRLVGSTWRKVPTPIVVKGIDAKWAVGSARGKAAMARWDGKAWRTYAIPAVPSAHRGQISELTDVAVDGETGRMVAVGWAAWPCGGASFCGETLLLTGYPNSFTYKVRTEAGFQPRAQAVPDHRGGAWVVYTKGGVGRFLHVRTDDSESDYVESGVLPAPAGRKTFVRDLAVQLESRTVFAVGGAPSGRRDGLIWAYGR
ncbi:hypothetical protein GCM10009677_06310 [Sphaerisporangium rubeum]|uniref:hypothetical protein n=1 Tax=Sphaerisporangium rubeum TaxID=321317 RepID=UPI0031D839DD